MQCFFHLYDLLECASISSDTWGNDTLQGNVVVSICLHVLLKAFDEVSVKYLHVWYSVHTQLPPQPFTAKSK